MEEEIEDLKSEIEYLNAEIVDLKEKNTDYEEFVSCVKDGSRWL